MSEIDVTTSARFAPAVLNGSANKLNRNGYLLNILKIFFPARRNPIVGNLGKDPDLRYTPQGKAVANFSLATNEKRKDKSGEMVDITTWFKITVWGNQAENAAKYLYKGSPIYIQGRLQIEEWTDRDNNNRYTLAVNASDMQFISAGKKNDDAGEYRHSQAADSFPSHSEAAAPTPATPVSSVVLDDDIPFLKTIIF